MNVKRINDAQTVKAAEITVASKQFGDAVLQAQGGNVRVVNQVARRARLAYDLIEQGNVAFGLGEQNERGRSKDAAQIVERDVQGDRRMEHPGVRHNPEELVDARPGDGPGKATCGQALDQLERGAVSLVGLHFSVNQDVRINGLHELPPVHQVKQRGAVKDIYSGKLGGFPALKAQLVRRSRFGAQRPAQQVVGDRLESSPFFGRFLFQRPE